MMFVRAGQRRGLDPFTLTLTKVSQKKRSEQDYKKEIEKRRTRFFFLLRFFFVLFLFLKNIQPSTSQRKVDRLGLVIWMHNTKQGNLTRKKNVEIASL